MKKIITIALSLVLLTAAHTTLAADAGVPFVAITETDHIFGAKDAQVSVVVYTDFECPFCKRHHPVLQTLEQEYRGKVNIVYRNFPLSFHQYAYPTAIAAECIAAHAGNDAYFIFIDKIFSDEIAEIDLLAEAKKAGLTEAEYNACKANEEILVAIDRHVRQASQYNINGTPGNLIVDNTITLTANQMHNATLINGAQPIEVFQTAIDAILESTQSTAMPTTTTPVMPEQKRANVNTAAQDRTDRICKRVQRFEEWPNMFTRVNNRIEKRFGFRCDS
jgi:protein-disulfide isomerase